MYLITFLILLASSGSDAVGKFLKIENCTSTNKSINIPRCEIVDGALFVDVDVLKPIEKLYVSNFSSSNNQ
jgi:hypothetical protein